MKKARAQFGMFSVWIKVPRRWLFVPSLSQLLANDPSIISDTQSADKWRDLDEIKDNCHISLIDRPPPIFARTWSRDQKIWRWPDVLFCTQVECASPFIEPPISSSNYQDQYILFSYTRRRNTKYPVCDSSMFLDLEKIQWYPPAMAKGKTRKNPMFWLLLSSMFFSFLRPSHFWKWASV